MGRRGRFFFSQDRIWRPALRIKLLTFRYSSTLGGFDDTALVDLVRDKEVLGCFRHLLWAARS